MCVSIDNKLYYTSLALIYNLFPLMTLYTGEKVKTNPSCNNTVNYTNLWIISILFICTVHR